MIHGPALLFCPGDRPDRFEKAATSADTVILDLEDAVAPADKAAARAAVIASTLDPARTIIRLNPAGTRDLDLDLVAVARTPVRTLMLAKTEDAAQLDALTGYRVVALVETARGVENVSAIAAHPTVVAVMWGADDLIASMGGRSSRFDDGTYRDAPRYARARVLTATRAHGKVAVDAVHIDIADTEGLRAEVQDAAASGFAATACIHPSQVAVIREGYAPTAAQREGAQRLIDAASASAVGVFRFEGRMIDEPLLRQARALLGG